MEIHCCGCNHKVEARLTSGKEIYSHRPDLFNLPFWKCDSCNNYVGCHHKTKNKTKPLGCIPTKEIKNARKHIHILLDPIWKKGLISRGELYSILSEKIGKKYHTAEIQSVSDARLVYKAIKKLQTGLPHRL